MVKFTINKPAKDEQPEARVTLEIDSDGDVNICINARRVAWLCAADGTLNMYNISAAEAKEFRKAGIEVTVKGGPDKNRRRLALGESR